MPMDVKNATMNSGCADVSSPSRPTNGSAANASTAYVRPPTTAAGMFKREITGTIRLTPDPAPNTKEASASVCIRSSDMIS